MITKGQRRLRGLFEGGIVSKNVIESMSSVDLGPMFEGKTDYSSTLKCLSDTVNYNTVKVETVNVNNFRYLYFLCDFMLITAFLVLVIELYMKHRPTTVTAL